MDQTCQQSEVGQGDSIIFCENGLHASRLLLRTSPLISGRIDGENGIMNTEISFDFFLKIISTVNTIKLLILLWVEPIFTIFFIVKRLHLVNIGCPHLKHQQRNLILQLWAFTWTLKTDDWQFYLSSQWTKSNIKLKL